VLGGREGFGLQGLGGVVEVTKEKRHKGDSKDELLGCGGKVERRCAEHCRGMRSRG
jgi:hypothetical protein